MPEEISKKIIIGLSSGRQIEISKLMLYPEPELNKLMALRAKAQEELGGFSTGIGFLGSPGWVVGSATALGVLESLVSDSKAKKGVLLLKEATAFHENLQHQGLFFDISTISGIDSPHPANWYGHGFHTLKFDLNSMGLMERSKFFEERELGMRQAKELMLKNKGTVTEEASVSFNHDGDEFVWILIDGQLTALRWSYVESYQVTETVIKSV